MYCINNLRYFLTVIIFILSCSFWDTQPPENVPGCTSSYACNYDPSANEDDGSCIISADMCGTCDNDPDNDCIKDCAGIWGGNTPQSECDICIEYNSGEFDCSGNCCKNDLIFDINSLF